MTKTYILAIAAHDTAIAVYASAVADYRNGKTADTEFLAAKTAYAIAAAAFDTAYETEANLPEATETVTDDTQLSLL